jgi:hypothetical protein
LYPPLLLSACTTFHEVTHAPALFESPRDKYTIFVLHIHLGLKPLGGYSRQNGVSALGAFKTGQAHLEYPSEETEDCLASPWVDTQDKMVYLPLEHSKQGRYT